MKIKTEIGSFQGPGARVFAGRALFTFETRTREDAFIHLYDKRTKKKLCRVRVPSTCRRGRLLSICLTGPDWENTAYLIEKDGAVGPDPYGTLTFGRETWADKKRIGEGYRVTSGLITRPYAWKDGGRKRIPDEDLIIYHLHMRGFTMLSSFAEEDRGNYRGFLKRLKRIRDYGFNTVEFMPLYDFEDLRYQVDGTVLPGGRIKRIPEAPFGVNYWGYTDDAAFFSPKASYFGEDPDLAMKEMVDKIHRAGMEILMEMAFSPRESDNFILSCLHYWAEEYHIDGFRLMGAALPLDRIAKDPGLSDVRIFSDKIPSSVLDHETPAFRHFYLQNSGFLYPLRKLQNHKDGSIIEFANMMKRQNESFGFVNFAASPEGFTLLDAYSYAEKHNELNGEDNRDGNNFNFSDNYGFEGETQSKAILEKRIRHIRTALSVVLLAQGIPLIRSGDTRGNSQEGNNNPYCQDNPLGWTIFSKKREYRRLSRYIKRMIAFRKAHPVLSLLRPAKMTDFRHIGLPDLSYHGREPWTVWLSDDRKGLGILYCGAYGKSPDEEDIMVCFNFYLGDETFALPHLLGKREWFYVTDTSSGSWPDEPTRPENGSHVVVPGGSLMILIGREPEEDKPEKKEGRKRTVKAEE